MNTETLNEEIEERKSEILNIQYNFKMVPTEREKEIVRLNRQISDLRRIHNAILDRNKRRSKILST